MTDSNQRKRAHSTVHELGRNTKNMFRGPSPRPPEAAPGAEQSLGPSTSQPTIPATDNTSTTHLEPPTATHGLHDQAQNTMSKLERALKGLRISAKLCPPLASATEGLLDCMDVMKHTRQKRGDFDKLIKSLAQRVADVEKDMQQVATVPQASEFVRAAACELQMEVEYIQHKKNKSGRNRLAEATNDIDDLMECYQRIERVAERLQSKVVLSVWWITNEQRVNTLLEGMQPAKTAWYDSAMAAVVGRRACTPDTRIAILEELREWAGDTDSAKVYWINGMAGTGKTTISYTFCEELKQKHELGASFFCSHRLPDCRDASRIIPTIAYQLARFSNPFQAALCRALDKDPDLVTRHVGEQFEKLLSEPLLEVNDIMVAGKVVVVVEALDECAVQVHLQQFIDALFRRASTLPVRFFVTSRPTPILYEKLQSQYASSRSLLRLHDIAEAVVQRDIRRYLTAELAGVPTGTIERLAELSGKLFIFAATVVGYVRPRGGPPRLTRLDAIISATWNPGDEAYRSIDALYTAILSVALSDEESTAAEKAMTMQVLYAVICAREPLTANALAGLLGTRVDVLELALEPLRPVLHVSEDDRFVSTLHASFPDYMLNKERSERYFCDSNIQNVYLARRCLETMRALLRFNICGLETSYLLDEEVPDLKRRIERSIPSHLAYACRYTGEHIRRANAEQELVSCCVEFVKTQMMYWTEVLNLMECVSSGITTLAAVQDWLQLHPDDDTDKLLHNEQKFLHTISRHDVRLSTPHLYVSVLALWSREEPMWRWYGTQLRGLPWDEDIATGDNALTVLGSWTISKHGTDFLGVPHVSDSPMLRAYAPDGSRYARKYYSDIYVCDTRTGHIVSGPYTTGCDWHYRSDPSNQCHRSYPFSYNGKWVAMVSAKHDVVLWNTHTYQRPTSLPKLDSEVDWVDLSPGDLLVACHRHEGFSIWNLCTLTRQASIEPHAVFPGPLAWSPDSSRLAMVDSVGVYWIWSTCTGQKLFRIGGAQHSGLAKYSSSGTLIALICHDEFTIWDAYAGNKLVGPLEVDRSPLLPVFTPGFDMPPQNDEVPWEVQTTTFTPNGYFTWLTLRSDQTQLKWEADTNGQVALPSSVRSCTLDKDGWVIAPNLERWLWIVPSRFSHPGWTSIMTHHRGLFETAWDTVTVGERWTECWIG